MDKDFSTARRYYDVLLKKDVNDVATIMNLAALEAQEANYGEMVKLFKRALAARPDYSPARVLLAQHYVDTRNVDQARTVLGEMMNVDSSDPAVLAIVAQVSLASDEPEKALRLFKQLDQVQPGSAQNKFLLAQAYAALNQDAAAIEVLRAAIDADPAYAPPQVALAKTFMLKNDRTQFLEVLASLEKLAPQDPDVLMMQGRLAVADGNSQKAAAKYAEAFKTAPTQDTFIVLQEQRWKAGEHNKVIADEREWIKQHPQAIGVRMILAEHLLAQGKTDEAISQYRAVVAQNSNHVLALNNLAWFLKDINPKDAMQFAERAAMLNPDSAAILDTLSMVQLSNGNLSAARDASNRALAKAPKDAGTRYHHAMIRAALGERAQAREILQALLSEEVAFLERDKAAQLLSRLRE